MNINKKISDKLSMIGVHPKASMQEVSLGFETLIKNRGISLDYFKNSNNGFTDYKVTIGNLLSFYGTSRFDALYSAYVDILQYEYSSDMDITIKNGYKSEAYPSLLSERLKLESMKEFVSSPVEFILAINIPYYDIEKDIFLTEIKEYSILLNMNNGEILPKDTKDINVSDFKKKLRESSNTILDGRFKVSSERLLLEDLLTIREELLGECEMFIPVFISGLKENGEGLELQAFLDYSNGKILKPFGLTVKQKLAYDTIHSCSLFVNSNKHNIHSHIKVNPSLSMISHPMLLRILKRIDMVTEKTHRNMLKRRAFLKEAHKRYKYDNPDKMLSKEDQHTLNSVLEDFKKEKSPVISMKSLQEKIDELYREHKFLLVDSIIYQYRLLPLSESKVIPKTSSFWKKETALDYPYTKEEKRIKNFFVWSHIIAAQGSISLITNSSEFNEEVDYLLYPGAGKILSSLTVFKIEDYTNEHLGKFLYKGTDFIVNKENLELTPIGKYKLRNISEILNEEYLIKHQITFDMAIIDKEPSIIFNITPARNIEG